MPGLLLSSNGGFIEERGTYESLTLHVIHVFCEIHVSSRKPMTKMGKKPTRS